MARNRKGNQSVFRYIVYPASERDERLCGGFGSRRDDESWIVFLTREQAQTMRDMLDGTIVGLIGDIE